MNMEDLHTEKIKDFEIRFHTKPGVFSRRGLDAGTRLLLDNISVSDGAMIADLGCGSGVLGFTVAKLTPKGHVHLLDSNLRTVELAKVNADLNRLKNVEVYLSDLFSAVSDRCYHLILSNPPQHLGNEFLDETAGECLKHLKKGGEVFWVMQSHLKPVAKRLFEKHFGNCTIVAHTKGYVVIKAIRRRD